MRSDRGMAIGIWGRGLTSESGSRGEKRKGSAAALGEGSGRVYYGPGTNRDGPYYYYSTSCFFQTDLRATHSHTPSSPHCTCRDTFDREP